MLRSIDRQGKGSPNASQFLERMAQESELEAQSLKELHELFSEGGMAVNEDARQLKMNISKKLKEFEMLSINSTKKTKELLGKLH